MNPADPHPVRAPQRIPLGFSRRLAGAVLGCAAALLRASPRRGGNDATAPVLLLEPFGMGDVISLEPLVRELRSHGREVRVAAKAAWRELLPASLVSTWVDARIPWTSYNDGSKYQPGALGSAEFRQFRTALREAARGAVGVDPRGDPRSVFLLRWAGCREVLTLSHYLGTDARNVRAAASQVEFADDLKRWELSLRFLAPLGLTSGTNIAPPQFPHLATPCATGIRKVGLVPVAPWAGKLWGREKWGALNLQLRAEGWETVGLCGPQQTDMARAELGDSLGVNECASLAAWASALASCAGIVAVDTGPMHLADALGVPTLALFGQGQLPLWSPSGARSRVIDHQDDADFAPCHPIAKHAPFGRKFMDRISVAEVLAAVRAIGC